MLVRRIKRLLGAKSPSESERWAQLGTSMMQAAALGIERVGARRAELIASGMTLEEAQAALLREVILGADPAFLAYTEGVVMRSFGSLYEDGAAGR